MIVQKKTRRRKMTTKKMTMTARIHGETVTVHDSWNFDDDWGTNPKISAGCKDPIDFDCS